jgi:23S rRNA (adenine2503-C2)-methyltransferase
MALPPLLGMHITELEEKVKILGLPAYTARQIADWLYKKDITSIEEMSNLSKAARQKLSEHYAFGTAAPESHQASSDGTKKYLFQTGPHRFVEAAYIPEKSRATLCLSTQVGCKMGCLFCMTGKQGFQANLSTAQIINQVRSLPERESLSNLVYMGMGEPFDNTDNVMRSLEVFTAEWGFAWSPRRITVSTIGILPAMERFLQESECHLAVSLHSPFDEDRRQLMPIQHVYPLEEVIAMLKEHGFRGQRRVSFEYIMFKGINDQPAHVKALSRLLYGLRCRINLMRFHPIPGTPLQGTAEEDIVKFAEALNAKGIRTTIRASRGQDIDAACGLLSTKELVKRAGEEESL